MIWFVDCRVVFVISQHILTGCKTDPSRMHGKAVKGETLHNVLLTLGFGCVQRSSPSQERWCVLTWRHNDHEMPTIQYRPFIDLSPSLKPQLFKVFESVQNIVDSQLTNPFPNKVRTKLCLKRLNKALGFPLSCSKFEYFDIVLYRNTILPKHTDSKNDHRAGYNFCAVYSFYQLIDDLEYKVSVIMTTCTSLGAALEESVTV